MTVAEPSREHYHRRTLGNRLATWWAATRPPFLGASVLPVLAAGALAWQRSGHVPGPLLLVAVAAIALVHAGANVLNDYCDGASGNDDDNSGRLHPFTGGSRFIQNGILSARETLSLAVVLLAAGAALGLLAAIATGPWLVVIGSLGGLVAVAYSLPGGLAARGLGDLAIVVTFGLLPLAGTSLMLGGDVPAAAWWIGAGVGCLAAAILWVASIPDIPADRRVGKLTLPARLGATWAARLLPAWFAAGLALVALAPLPRPALAVLGALFPAVLATRAAIAGRFERAIPLTIVTHAAACLLLIAGLLLAR